VGATVLTAGFMIVNVVLNAIQLFGGRHPLERQLPGVCHLQL
jgi:hypothetical protein